METKQKMTRKLYTQSQLTIAQLAQLKIWLGRSKSSIIGIAVDELFEKVANEQESNAAPKA